MTTTDPGPSRTAAPPGAVPAVALRGVTKNLGDVRAVRGGITVADLAGALFLSPGTVRDHLSAAIGKTGVRTRAEAVAVAETSGWL